MKADTPPPGLMAGQLLHIASLAILLTLTCAVWRFIGQPVTAAFWTAAAFPVVHQVYVWLAWRFELRSSATSKTIGFKSYLVLFFLLFGGRFVSLLWLAWLDRGSLGLPMLAQAILTAILTIIGLYALYSVKRYFGMVRAAGADHFEPRYRKMPLVRGGIFRFTSNGMYLYAFLLFWAVAVGFDSTATLVVAAFSHLSIWVHFFATEKPDMAYLYSAENAR
jgi:hypothetical protein